jgi:mannose/fructose/N-acetylgalactosamine-specific phosphotransferase system component IIC
VKRKTVLGLLNKVMPSALSLTGSMLVALGIGMVYQPAGWMAAGLMAWLLEWRYYGGSEAER